jgi:hypothetical protein
VRVLRVYLPLERWTEAAWGLTNAQGLDGGQLASWRRNGLNAGLLKLDKAQVFLERLGQSGPEGRLRLMARPGWARLHSGPPLEQPTRLIWTTAGWLPQRLRLPSDGGCHLLIRTQPPKSDQQAAAAGGAPVPKVASFVLVPHYHQTRPSLLPRNATERLLEGQLFEPLSLRVSLQSDQVLAVALHNRGPTMPSLRQLSQALIEPETPLRLGHLILTGQLNGRAYQTILLIRASVPERATPAESIQSEEPYSSRR